MRILVFSLLVGMTSAACGVPSTGMWWSEGALVLTDHDAGRMGGPLTPEEGRTIEEVSRAELERAFAGLRISFNDRQDAFWRIEVVHQLPGAGEAHTWGLRGSARVGATPTERRSTTASSTGRSPARSWS